jgi:hypothetical protein
MRLRTSRPNSLRELVSTHHSVGCRQECAIHSNAGAGFHLLSILDIASTSTDLVAFVGYKHEVDRRKHKEYPEHIGNE